MGIIKGLSKQQKRKVEDAVALPDYVKEYGSWAKENIPNFNKLKHDKKTSIFRSKWLQQNMYVKDGKKVPDHYADSTLIARAKEQVAKAMGLATGSTDTVGKDSAGREQSLGKQKRMNPRGFSRGGKVSRGRSAQGSAEKNG